MPDARRTRSLVCKQKTHELVTTGPPQQSGIPCAMVLRLPSYSPRCAGLDSHRHRRKIIRRFDLSIGRPGPYDFAVRTGALRLAHQQRPSHPASYVRDDREAPLLRRTGQHRMWC